MTCADDFPDIRDILERKEAGRRRLAGLSFAEKVQRVERMRAAMAPLRALREAKEAARAAEPRDRGRG